MSESGKCKDNWAVQQQRLWHTSHSAYVATETKLVGAKIDGLLPPIFFVDSENVSEKFLHRPSLVMILKKVGFFQNF